MSIHLHDIDPIFKNAYDGHKEAPSFEAWQKIAVQLERENNKKPKTRNVEWKYAAVVFVCIISALGLNQMPHNFSYNDGITNVTSKQNPTHEFGKGPSLLQSSADPNYILPGKSGRKSNAISGHLTANDKRELSTITEVSNPLLPNKYIKPAENHRANADAIYGDVVQQIWLGNLEKKTNKQFPKINPLQDDGFAFRPFKPFWTLSIFASNDWANYRLDADLPDEIEEIHKRESLENSFSIGLSATRQITNHWALKTGLTYSNTAIAIGPQEIYAMKEENGNVAFKFITSSGYSFLKPKFGSSPSIGDSLKSAEAQHNLSFLSIPIMGSYKFGSHGKWSFATSAGISLNFLTKAAVQTEVTDLQNRETVNINKLKGLRHVSIGLVSDMSIQYHVSAKWAINFQPMLRYTITSITSTNIVKTFPYSVGIGAGITYKL